MSNPQNTDTDTPPTYTTDSTDDLVTALHQRLIEIRNWPAGGAARDMARDVVLVLRAGLSGATLVTTEEQAAARADRAGVEQLAAWWSKTNPDLLLEHEGDAVAATLEGLNAVVGLVGHLPTVWQAVHRLLAELEPVVQPLLDDASDVAELYGLTEDDLIGDGSGDGQGGEGPS